MKIDWKEDGTQDKYGTKEKWITELGDVAANMIESSEKNKLSKQQKILDSQQNPQQCPTGGTEASATGATAKSMTEGTAGLNNDWLFLTWRVSCKKGQFACLSTVC